MVQLSSSTFSNAGGAVSDLFGSFAAKSKAAGDRAEAGNYRLAAQYADQNVVYSQWSTAIKEHQADRELTKSLGQTTADVSGAGFAAGGSGLDILRESASEGALAKSVLGEQGLITQEGYKQQSQSYRNMADAADMAAKAEDTASTGALIAGGVKLAAGVAGFALGGPAGAAAGEALGGGFLVPGFNPIGQGS